MNNIDSHLLDMEKYMTKINNELLTKTICQLGFRCGQECPQPAKEVSGFDRKATRNPQLHIVPSVMPNFNKNDSNIDKHKILKNEN